jgi:NCS1 family nucleobase:cation symporter-1
MATTTSKKSKMAHYMGKLAIESEPGLTNAQLMLYNEDLKPVEPARRQWGMKSARRRINNMY